MRKYEVKAKYVFCIRKIEKVKEIEKGKKTSNSSNEMIYALQHLENHGFYKA